MVAKANRTADTGPSRAAKAAAVIEGLRGHWRTHSDREIANLVGVSPTTVGRHRKRLEEAGEIPPRAKSGQPIEARLKEVSTSAVRPSPKNDKLYEPIRLDDPAFLSLAEDVRVNGILEPLVISSDGYIISGHRRHAAARHVGLQTIPVRIVADVSRSTDQDKFFRLLTSHNKQRVKTTAEFLREGVAGMDENTWQRVCQYRREAAAVAGVQPIELAGEKTRFRITQKLGLKRAIERVIEENAADWPLSDRRVFYLLLNIEGLLRNDVRQTPFSNTPEYYNDVTDLLTRMRLDGSVPFDSIADETRPVIQWNTHRSVDTFVEQQLGDLFCGYWRDLMQSQPNQIELLVEKNTVATALRAVAAKYTIPMTSGRGYSSLPPRKAMVDRFRSSGREKLVLIVVSDFDPEGEDIPNAFGLSLRDDFEISAGELVVVKAALRHEQTQTVDLHEGQLAKEGSARYKRFTQAYGERCWELEAIPSDTLRTIVEHAIRRVIDLEAFGHELDREQDEQFELDGLRRQTMGLLAELGDDTVPEDDEE